MRRPRQPVADDTAHRFAIADRDAEVGVGEVHQVVAELFARRLVQAELAEDLRPLLRPELVRLLAQQVVERVPRGHTGQREVHRDCDGEDECVLDGLPKDERRHGAGEPRRASSTPAVRAASDLG
jgi:hypothetical protein